MTTVNIPSTDKLRELALSFIKDKRLGSYKQMVKDGELDLYLDTTVENCRRLATSLIESGMAEGLAWDQAVKMEIYESEE